MQKPPHFWRAILNGYVLLPLSLQVVALGVVALGGFAANVLRNETLAFSLVGFPLGGLFAWHCVRSGRRDVRRSAARFMREHRERGGRNPPPYPADPRFAIRHLPVLVLAAFTLGVSMLALLPPAPERGALFGPFASVFSLTHLPSSLFLGVVLLMGVPSPWPLLVPPLAIYLFYGAGMALGFRDLGCPRTTSSSRVLPCTLLLVVLVAIVWRAEAMRSGFVTGGGWAEWRAENTFNARHHPFDPDNTLVKVTEPTLRIESDHPTLDGATALYPIYAAAVQATFRNYDRQRVRELIRASTTPKAYDRLIAGEVDLVFVAQPSDAQRAAAEAAGRPLVLTPIGREAFVFFVHADNPVDGLTSEQIRAIYTKRITNWKEVGGRDEKIIPFQRPQGSGSQTALELKVMQSEKPAAPLREEFARGMGGVIQQVAAYKNSREALGYSFRVFATAMNPDGAIKFLAVDGIAPHARRSVRANIPTPSISTPPPREQKTLKSPRCSPGCSAPRDNNSWTTPAT